jgi:hypothetical protein
MADAAGMDPDAVTEPPGCVSFMRVWIINQSINQLKVLDRV